MKPITYHLLNSLIAAALVIFGSLSTLLTGDPTTKEVEIGMLLGVLAGLLIFLNKFNDWFSTQDPDCKVKILNFL